MFPAFSMTIWHLRLKKASKLTRYCPSNSIAQFNTTFYNEFIVGQSVNVYPYTFIKNLFCNFWWMCIFYQLSSSWISPKAITCSVGMFAESSGSNWQFWRILDFLPDYFVLRNDGMRFVESFNKCLKTGPRYVLTSCGFSKSKHQKKSSWSNSSYKIK